jgi:putative ABC transport system permease protein
VDSFLQDIRFGYRMLRRTPGFTAVAILTLALGIGANTAIFSVVNAVLLRPLPYRDPGRLISLASGQSLPDLNDFAAQSRTITRFGAFGEWPLDLLGHGEPRSIPSALVGGSLFETLGVRPLLGRTLTATDDQIGGAHVVVASYGFWKAYLNADPNVIGSALSLSGVPYTVVGVMPAGFELPRGTTQLWIPLKVGYPEAADVRAAQFLYAIGRLRDGIGIDDAQAEVDVIGKRLGELYPDADRNRHWLVVPLHQRVVGKIRTALLVLLASVGCVLLIACANFASLLLAKAAARRREISVRSALGAQRWRIVRQLLTESLLLSLGGGVVGAGVAFFGVDLLIGMKPEGVPRLDTVAIDGAMLAFTIGISVLTGLLFGLIPAFQASRLSAESALHASARASEESFTRPGLRRVLVVAELAVSLVLLTGAGLLIRSFWKLQSVDPGFRQDRLLTLSFQLPIARYEEIPKQEDFFAQLDESVKNLPGVESAAIISELPLAGSTIYHTLVVEGQPPVTVGNEPEALAHEISSDYFRTMGIPLVRGRDFTRRDKENSARVAIVTATFAKELLKGRDPIGARVRWARLEQQDWVTIVGVVGDTKHSALDADDASGIYTPLSQKLQPWKRWGVVVVKSKTSDALSLAPALKQLIWSSDPLLPLTEVKSMTEVMSLSVAQKRFNALLLGIFAGSALLLAIVGIYGVISYLVTQRTHEIGIRMALGAQPADVLRMVVRHGLKLVAFGLVGGIAGALAATRALSALLFDVKAADPLTFILTPALLFSVALLASYIPARRAAKVDPMVALRYE